MVDNPDFPTTSIGLTDAVDVLLPDRTRGPAAPRFANVAVNNLKAGEINPIDNVLNQYDSYTYKWTLYLADASLHNGPNADETFKAGTVIAESGNAGRFFIESVNIEQLISINSITRNMPFTKVSFNIVEPKGIGFMDSLLKATKHLNIPNYVKAPYYLQLDFWGWKDGVEVLVPEASRKWSLQLFGMKTNVTSDGSTYGFEGIAADDLGTMNHTSIAAFSISIRNAITIQDFFDQWSSTMNDFLGKYKDILYNHIDKMTVIVDDEIKDLKFGGSVTDDKRNASALTTNDDEKLINLPKGFDMSTLVENLMVATPAWEPEIQMPVTGSRTIKRDDFTRVWSIETEVEYLEYDVRRQDYARNFIFNIKPIKLVRSAGDVDRGDIQFAEGRFVKLTEEFEIKKLYHYIFTGLNTEVLNFELDLAMMWYNEMPLHLGKNTNAPGDSGRMVSQAGVDTLPRSQATVKKDLLDSRDTLSAINQNNAPELGFEPQLPPPVNEINIVSTEVARERALSEEFRNLPNTTAFGSAAEANKISDQINSLRGKIPNPRFIEDVASLNTSDSFKTSDIPDEENIGASIYSLRFDPTREDTTKMLGISGSSEGPRAFIATYLNYYVNAEMFQLDLEIRGDPFWIPLGKFERRSLGATIIPPTDLSSNVAMDPIYRDHILILNMKSPKPENPDGFYETEDNDLYTGVYQIYSVENIFENGVFTQKLTGIKDALTDLRVLRNRI